MGDLLYDWQVVAVLSDGSSHRLTVFEVPDRDDALAQKDAFLQRLQAGDEWVEMASGHVRASSVIFVGLDLRTRLPDDWSAEDASATPPEQEVSPRSWRARFRR
ncbi:MAG TPA: hypothetical protein VFN76_09700 [Candidatus Limnocylindria bacterium]|jgi:hypothetical protein|nr:hypothetical protein [Candidatus Limnocylindria bacterium]